MYLHQGPIVHALLSAPPYPRYWRSYVVLPQPRWSGEKLMAPKTVKALPRSARVIGTRWSFKTCQCPAKAGEACPLTAEECGARAYGEGGALAKDHRQAEARVMSVHDAEPGDVYVDEAGKLWRCVSICREPTVTMEEVEGQIPGSGQLPMLQGRPLQPRIEHVRRSGGVSGLMWNGWKRIWRKEEPKVSPAFLQPDAAHAKTSPGPVNCQTRLRFQNLTMPKTCERCGLGPCPFFNNDGTRRVT